MTPFAFPSESSRPSPFRRVAMIAAAMLGAATATTSAAADEPTSFDVAAQVSAARAGIEIDRIVGSGSGCPQGTWGGYLSDDRQTFYLRFSEFRPEITPASSERTASCRLAIVVSVPAGLSYQIQRIGYRGYAYLEQGVSAEMSTSYYFQNDRSRGEQYRTPLKGPLDDTYSIDDQPLDGGLWSPCGRSETQTLNVQLDVKLRNGSPRRDGTLELNEALGFRLGWRRCDRR